MSDLTWMEWLWTGRQKINPATAEDAAHNTALRAHFTFMLDFTDYPEVFKASQVAEMLNPQELAALGYEECKEAIPAIYVLAWELREFGDVVILRKGKVLGDHVRIGDVDGPVRFRRAMA